MVTRLKKIFGNPESPKFVVQKQFDGAQASLEKTSRKAWHEIDQSDYWHTLLDICYVDLQQDLFDYLFPALLIRWWEGQMSRKGGPESECDFYRAIDHGQVFIKMMDSSRSKEVFSWMTDAYLAGIDEWSGKLSVAYDPNGANDLHGPLWSFHALGQSVPITHLIVKGPGEVSTEGRAQWWLVFATGLVWNENQCNELPIWTPESGGGGVYITESEASIFDHGFLTPNLHAACEFFTMERVRKCLEMSVDLIPSFPHGDWAKLALEEFWADPQKIEIRLQNYLKLLALPNLGGFRQNPLASTQK